MLKEADLLELKEKMEQAKTKQAELIGRKKYLMQELEKEWECKTTIEASSLIKEMKEEIEALENKIAEGLRKLEALMQEQQEE